MFDNIYIILPTHDKHFILFNIHEFDGDSFMKKIGTHNTKALPTCTVVKLDKDQSGAILFEYSIINYKQEEQTNEQR